MSPCCRQESSELSSFHLLVGNKILAWVPNGSLSRRVADLDQDPSLSFPVRVSHGACCRADLLGHAKGIFRLVHICEPHLSAVRRSGTGG